jgi:hypothetical protein
MIVRIDMAWFLPKAFAQGRFRTFELTQRDQAVRMGEMDGRCLVSSRERVLSGAFGIGVLGRRSQGNSQCMRRSRIVGRRFGRLAVKSDGFRLAT